MKGLLVRDIRILKNQIKWLGMGCVVLVAAQLFFEGTLAAFVTCFVIAAAMLTSNTISSDEEDGGFGYLFTLPMTRRCYVSEKYLVGVGMIFFVLLASGICTAIGELILEKGMLNTSTEALLLLFGGSAFMGILYISLMIPLYLKFGSANGKLILPLIVWGLLFLMIGAVQLNRKFQWDLETVIMEFPRTAGNAGAAAALVIASFILLAISWLCSCRIMDRKEF